MERNKRTLMNNNFNFESFSNLSWIKRALNPKTPMTEARESILAASSEYRGKEILYPTVRMIGGSLKKLSDQQAFRMAIKNQDFIEFDTPEQATRFSKGLSNYIAKLRDK
jgi:hypothetical protein